MKDVTLIVFEGVRAKWNETRRVFDYCRRLFDFGAEHYITKDFTKQEAMIFENGGPLPYVETSHALICTWDGFITNPHLWRDEWLQYDMIGAPWPAGWGFAHRVGNTGFTLQSRRFLQAATERKKDYDPQWEPSDVWLCRTLHDSFVGAGIRYAPVEVAAAFSWEHRIEEGLADRDKSFGFHGWVDGKQQEDYYALL
jgi:hypothetical protein